jgi:hypothetical protein
MQPSHNPMMQACSDGQSAVVLQEAHDPPGQFSQTPPEQKIPWPEQSLSTLQPGEQTPAVHTSPDAQSRLMEHVHCIDV